MKVQKQFLNEKNAFECNILRNIGKLVNKYKISLIWHWHSSDMQTKLQLKYPKSEMK
jgi:hypothetical protein